MYKLVNFCTLMYKTRKTQNCLQKIDFWLNPYEICGCHGNVQNDRHTAVLEVANVET